MGRVNESTAEAGEPVASQPAARDQRVAVRARSGRPAHPAVAATVLMVGIVVFLVLVAALPMVGR
jgi:hypothetical protein